MGLYKYVKNAWKKPKENIGTEDWKQRMIQLRAEPALVKLERPTRIDKARSVGYKAKQGYVIVRSRVTRGGTKRRKITGGRRPKRYGRLNFSTGKNLQWVSEERASKKYPNCEVLNSYWVAQDSRHKWFEVILVDTSHPVIKNDKKINWITKQTHTNRVQRGLTSAGKRGRGLVRGSRTNTTKNRPSNKANNRQGK